MSLLSDFYNGKLYPYEELNTHDPDFKPIGDKISSEKYGWLKKLLSEKEFIRFEDKLQAYYYEANNYWSEKGFLYGFKLGALFMFDILAEKDNLFSNKD